MGETTELLSARPESQTEWHDLAARAHRHRGVPGDDSAARTHEHMAADIRDGRIRGSSKEPRNCPRCLARGYKYMLLWGSPGPDWCGTCHWPRE